MGLISPDVLTNYNIWIWQAKGYALVCFLLLWQNSNQYQRKEERAYVV